MAGNECLLPRHAVPVGVCLSGDQSGYVTPCGGQSLPLLAGFFGGPQLVRGFASNGFGPRDVTPGTTMDNVGGNIYCATSAELQTAKKHDQINSLKKEWWGK